MKAVAKKKEGNQLPGPGAYDISTSPGQVKEYYRQKLKSTQKSVDTLKATISF